MSLQASKYIYKALSTNASIMSATSGRIYPVGRGEAEEQADEVPYIVIMPQGVREELTKDGLVCEIAPIVVLVCAKTWADLLDLVEKCRDAVQACNTSSEGWPFVVVDSTFSATAPQLDAVKPCFFQELRWEIETEKV